MRRDLNDLTARTFDLLVVGGGICGLTIACDAAQRGLSVALIERHDFGAGSSFNHLRTIHGGLRHLQHLDVSRARESAAERRTLARIAPWALTPVPFVLPLDDSLTRGPMAMRAGFLIDRLVTVDRNDGVPPSHHLPAGRVVSAKQAREQCPILDGVRMSGAGIWYDYVTTEADRLTFAWAASAADAGAILANYVEAVSLIERNGRISGARCNDSRTGASLDISARSIVNATGARLDYLLQPSGLATKTPMTKAMNLVTTLAAPPTAVGGRSRTGRNFFLVPWRGRSLFGTWESGRLDPGDDLSVDSADVQSFVEDITQAFPSVPLTANHVTFVQRGVVPAIAASGRPVSPGGHERVQDHASVGHPELMSVAAAKYTTARAVAERVTNRILEVLQRARTPCRTATTLLREVPVSGDALLTHAAQHEMVVTLTDAVLRRTPLGALGPPTEPELTHAAAVVGDVLGWDERRRTSEIQDVRMVYAALRPLGDGVSDPVPH